jgi:hypothetical protein
VVAEVDAELAERVDDALATALSDANALQVPFDAEIAPGAPGNARVTTLVTSLRAVESVLFEVFDAFGLTVEIPE